MAPGASAWESSLSAFSDPGPPLGGAPAGAAAALGGASRRVPRDPQPLPRWHAPELVSQRLRGKSRGTNQKVRRACWGAKDVDGVISALNSLYTGKEGPRPPPGIVEKPPLSLAQESILEHIQDSVRRLGPPPSD